MSGYIGKIAAIVTANTSDFTSKLAGTKKELNAFSGSIQSTISAASNNATKSLNSIFTPLQKLTRALDAGMRAPLELVDILEVRKMQTLVSLSEGLAKPLAGATRQFEQLSQQAQANFLPALIRSQTAVKALQTQFEATGQASGTGFEQARRQIERTTQAVQRLAQAQQLASKTLTGNELQFRNPRLAQTLSAGAALSQQAAALPADRLQDGAIGRQTAALKQYQDAAVAAQARVENLRLTPNVDPSVLKSAESQLLNLIETANRAQAQFNQSVNPIGTGFTSRGAAAGPAGLGLFGSQVGGEAEQAVARARTLSAEFAKLPQAAQSGLAGLAGIASRISDEVSQTGSGASQLQKVLDRLQQSIKQTQNVAASGSTALIIRPPDADVKITKTPKDLVGDFEKLQRDRSQARQQSVSSALGPALDDPKRQLDATVGRVAALKGQLDSLPASIRSQFIPAIKAAEAQLLALAGSSNATPAGIKRATAEVARLEAGYKRAKQALAIPTSGDFLGNIDAQRAIGELEALRGVLSQVGARAGGSVAAAYDKLADATRRAVASGTLGLPRVQAELKQLSNDAARAAAETRKISFGRAQQRIQRGGDIATKQFNNVGLAVNQLAFAVDDFFSVTGSAEQRIRAIGNNITQFGLIVGQTKGLFVALAAVLATQLIIAITKYALGTAEAEKKQKQLEAAIKQVNSALERQLELTKELTQAYRSIAEAIGQASTSEGGQVPRSRRRELGDIRKQQQERRQEVAVSANPALGAARSRLAGLEEQLQTETNFGTRRDIQSEIRQLRARIKTDLERTELGAQVEIDRANRNNPGSPELARGELIDRRSGARARLDGLFRQLETPGLDPQTIRLIESRIAALSEQFAQLEVALLKLSDSAGNALVGRAQGISDQLVRAQADASRAVGPSRIEDQLNVVAQRLESALVQASSTNAADVAVAAGTVAALQKLSEELSQSAIIVSEFSDAVRQAASELPRIVEGELASRAESLRRQTNASEAQFGSDDQRTELLGNAQERVRRAQQDAADRRRQIDDTIRRRQNDLELDLQTGFGDPRAVDLARRARAAEASAADQSQPAFNRAQAAELAASLRQQLQSLFELDPEIAGLRGQADQVDVQAQREQQQIEQAIRGRELSLTPGERAGESLASDIEAIRQFYGQLAEATTGLVDFEAQAEATKRVTEDALRGAAPGIFALGDAVQNAVLQGPSRAALQATDVSTVEGASELNRLLRGDDAARDQDLVELQRQSKILEDMLEELRKAGAAGVAN